MRNGKVFRYSKILIFIALLVVEILIFFTVFDKNKVLGIPKWILVLTIEGVFTLSTLLNFFILKEFRHKLICYITEFFLQFVLTLLINGGYLLIIYILILSEYYMAARKLLHNAIMGGASLVTYIVTYVIATTYFTQQEVWEIATTSITQLLLIVLHFLAMNFALQSYDARQKIAESLKELDESNRKLQKAYDELAEVSILHERQRIAKDIHDTAGHSITTVIMQTEAAKLIVETDPQEAKRRIVAANLQAKNALEELRESVHLLAGDNAPSGLKGDLERIIHDSCDGTDVVIRYNIAEVSCSLAKRRFIANTLKEGISNGLRHGHATAFYFELTDNGGEINFLLSDNGKGAEGVLKIGFGLKSMRNRAESFGGKVTFSTAPDDGFEIKMLLPSDEVK